MLQAKEKGQVYFFFIQFDYFSQRVQFDLGSEAFGSPELRVPSTRAAAAAVGGVGLAALGRDARDTPAQAQLQFATSSVSAPGAGAHSGGQFNCHSTWSKHNVWEDFFRSLTWPF